MLKSGRRSSWFVDAKQTACRPEGMLLMIDAVLAVLPDDVTAMGGLTMGADPVAFAVAGQRLLEEAQDDGLVLDDQHPGHRHQPSTRTRPAPPGRIRPTGSASRPPARSTSTARPVSLAATTVTIPSPRLKTRSISPSGT